MEYLRPFGINNAGKTPACNVLLEGAFGPSHLTAIAAPQLVYLLRVLCC